MSVAAAAGMTGQATIMPTRPGTRMTFHESDRTGGFRTRTGHRHIGWLRLAEGPTRDGGPVTFVGR
jgi:hypothetical protein